MPKDAHLEAITYLVLVVVVMTLATFATRALPFVLLGGKSDHPLMLFLGQYLPPAVMTLLVIYSLKDVDILVGNHGFPEILAALLVVGLHVWRRNALLSIAGGTGLYIYFVQSGVF